MAAASPKCSNGRMQKINHDCPASLTRATSIRTPGPESGGSAHDGLLQQPSMQASAPAETPQCFRGNAADDDCHQSPLYNTLKRECESDSSPYKKNSAKFRGVCSLVTVASPTNANDIKQLSETNKVSQDSEVYSEVPCLGTNQNSQPHETATGDSETLIRAVRKLHLTTSTRTTTTITTTTANNSTSSSLSSGADFDVWRLRTDSERGAEGGNEETDTTLCGDLVELYDQLLQRIEEEKRREESIMGAISRSMVVVSSMSDYIRRYVLDVFGTQRPVPDRSRISSRYRRKGKRGVVQEEATRGPNGDFEQRLQAVKVYLDDGSDEMEAIPEEKAEIEEESGTVPVAEKVACCSTSSNANRASGRSSSNGAVAGCSGDTTPAVINRNEECKGRVAELLKQHSYSDIMRMRQAARKSLLVKIYDIVEQRIVKGKFTCRRLFRCMKSVATVVDLAVDAYSATELAMRKARRCTSAQAADILQAITSASSETSDWMWKTLRYVEAAVTSHAEIVEATEQAERSLLAVKLENPLDDGATRDVTAAVGDAVKLIAQYAVFRSRVPQSEEQASRSTCGTWPATSSDVGFKASPETAAAAGFQSVPADVLQNLLAATRTTFQAVGAAERALQFFATCGMCTETKLRKCRGRVKKIVKHKS